MDNTELINALRCGTINANKEHKCDNCRYFSNGCLCTIAMEHAANVIENLEKQLKKTGVFTTDGKEIMKGDKVTGLFLYAEPITGTVIFKGGSFGVEWNRGGTMEFTPFTSTCNVNWEVVQE